MSLLIFGDAFNGNTSPPSGPPVIQASIKAEPAPEDLPAGSVYFSDETAKNPLPPGILVTIYPAGADQTAANVVYSGYTQLGGSIPFNPMAAVQYDATFYGALGPTNTQSFYGSSLPGVSTKVSVAQYRSPFLSQAGYVDAQVQHWPPGRFPESAIEPNGVAYALAYTFAYLLAYFDIETQQNLSASRLQTCVASQIDSWVYDFFGQYLLRYPGETDAIFISRALAMFGPRCTIPAIKQVVQQFYIATALQTQQAQQQNLGYEVTGGYDERGGFDVYVPTTPIDELIPNVSVWDAQSNSSMAQTYNICPPKFVIQVDFANTDGWFLDYAYFDFDTFLTNGGALTVSSTAPDPRLGALVNLVKACGTQPMYGVSS